MHLQINFPLKVDSIQTNEQLAYCIATLCCSQPTKAVRRTDVISHTSYVTWTTDHRFKAGLDPNHSDS